MLGADLIASFRLGRFRSAGGRSRHQRKLHPRDWTLGNIAKSRGTLQALAIFYWTGPGGDYLPAGLFITMDPVGIPAITLKKGSAPIKPIRPVHGPSWPRRWLGHEQVADGSLLALYSRWWPSAKHEPSRFFRITDYAQKTADDINN